VAQRRVAVIQAEYQLKRAEDQFRLILGANQDPYVRALDLDLVENAEPSGELLAIDQKEALQDALRNRPEFAALEEQLASSEASIKRAHDDLLPDLNLTGFYSSNGLGGNMYDTASTPPALISRGGLGDALGQVYGFDFPSYGFSLTLNLPIRNRAAAADLGNARVARRRALYLTRQLHERVTQEVSEAVHQLEQAKLSIAATKVASDLARKNLEAEERKYVLGAQTIFFVLQAQTQLAQAEVSLLQSQVNYQLAVSSVEYARGKLLSHYQIQVDKITP
jgi:outer membrane protein TolC